MIRTLLITILLATNAPLFTRAKNLGVHGPTFVIEERNLLDVIQTKLQHLLKNGKIASINSQILEKVKHAALNPKPTNLPTTTGYSFRLFDPTYLVKHDITDHKGTIIAKAGTRINPLDQFKWGTPIILINGDDSDQITWAKTMKAKLVLVKGKPFQIAKDKNRRVYFDQGAKIIQHFGITHIPTKISQRGKSLLIEELPPITTESSKP